MSSIGGYFELEFDKNEEFHRDGIALNTGRNALEYILKANNYEKIFLPYYTCDVILQPIKKLNLDYEFYNINENLEPIFNYIEISDNQCFLYTNYFGLKDSYVREISKSCKNLIIDNAQAFFSLPMLSVDTFYSPRKFFGVSDGAYLFCKNHLFEDIEKDTSYKRMTHLLIRKDISAEQGYLEFKKNEAELDCQSIREMSKLTRSILSAINYNKSAIKRIENFMYLDTYLRNSNFFKWELAEDSVPMVYPYWSDKKNLKNQLIQSEIYSATYWPNVLDWCHPDSLEYKLTKEVVFLPIDHRYSVSDMDFIINIITNG